MNDVYTPRVHKCCSEANGGLPAAGPRRARTAWLVSACVLCSILGCALKWSDRHKPAPQSKARSTPVERARIVQRQVEPASETSSEGYRTDGSRMAATLTRLRTAEEAPAAAADPIYRPRIEERPAAEVSATAQEHDGPRRGNLVATLTHLRTLADAELSDVDVIGDNVQEVVIEASDPLADSHPVSTATYVQTPESAQNTHELAAYEDCPAASPGLVATLSRLQTPHEPAATGDVPGEEAGTAVAEPFRPDMIATLTDLRSPQRFSETGPVGRPIEPDGNAGQAVAQPYRRNLVATLSHLRGSERPNRGGRMYVERPVAILPKTEPPPRIVSEPAEPKTAQPARLTDRQQPPQKNRQPGTTKDLPREEPVIAERDSVVQAELIREPVEAAGSNMIARLTRLRHPLAVAQAEEHPAERPLVPPETKPAEKVPAAEVPAEKAPAEEVPAEEVPVEAAPTETSDQPAVAVDEDFRAMTDITTNILPEKEGDRPEDVAVRVFAQQGDAPEGSYVGRGWEEFMYQWEASALYHRPLYFEEINLERYGYSCNRICQPAVSAAHFFATVPAMPYKWMVYPGCERIYTLGHYRPGSCVPNQIHWLPLQPKASAVEAGVITGLIFAIP